MTGFSPPREITRRTLLLAGAGAAATAAIPDVARAAQKRLARSSHLARSTWEPLVGSVIEIRNPGLPPVPLTLLRVGDLPAVSKQDDSFRQGTFVLVFSGPAGQPLAGGVHVIKVPGAGKVPIWFADADLGELGWTYVAIFANSKRRQGLIRKPRGKGSRKQSRDRGEKYSPRPERKRRKKRRRRPEPATEAVPKKKETPPPPAEKAPSAPPADENFG